MTVYKYIGRTKTGAPAKGTIDAANKNAAITKLREKGINPRELTESKSILHMELSLGGAKVKNEDFVIYCRQFATLIRAGVSIVEATNILARQSTSKPLKKALDQIEDDIRTGLPFSEATLKHPKVFPALFTNMMRSGEATGNIDETLERLANTFEKQYNLKKKIQSTLTYPAVLLVITIFVVFFLLIFIVPTFVSTFEEMDAELPWITVFTVALSKWLQSFWWLVIGLVLIVIVVFRFLYKSNKDFNYGVHYAVLKMPIFGQLLQKSVIARLMRTLSSLFSSAVPILQALTISHKVVGNPVVGKVVLEARASLEKGSSLTEPLEKSWLFPPLVTSMTSIGESTGSLDYMLEKIADFYEAEVDRAVDTIKSLIEPMMILFLAVIVGFIVAAIMMPMFSLYEQI
ncbi:type II secretion system protein F [Ureibacillus massiliensis 4400831 = CIP 108448 = CCUG 49529]|uniref:Type II secretion system protein F n=1 Tax=Ureibacillus massiliensis 4400831 = CIP 108448 = CCUG 49529 TaxID=1211035 RepID=A0A0A3JW76_9BACL|nr:type II secretion system F family protein [Ureibacillus massiliensis]KGR91252.1 type II secretion system protein F [Ureibacillus massiliensis 4400831 = CIP 108448 = CCUG 49529]